MKIKLLILLGISTFGLIACTGGGDDDGSDGGGGVLPPDPTQQTYAYVTNRSGETVYVYPIFTNGNIDFSAGRKTTDVIFDQPHYIVVNNSNTLAYISDLGPGGSNGKVYSCNINQANGALNGCKILASGFADPYSIAVYNNKLSVANNTVNGYVVQCNLDGSSCVNINSTQRVGYQPWGVTVNDKGAFVTYTSNDSSGFVLYKYDVDANGTIIGSGAKFNSTSSVSGPTQLAVNGNNLFISSTRSNSVSQFGVTSLDVSGGPVSTIFKENYEISVNNNGVGATFAYISNISDATIQGVSYNGYISRCPIANGLLTPPCISLQSVGVYRPLGVAITGVLKP